jgi:hypothetical protein
MQQVQMFTEMLFKSWSMDSPGSVGVLLVLYFFGSWLICFAAAFLKVSNPRYYVALLSLGMSILVSLLLAGICRYYLPDLADSFTPSGLMLFSSLASLVVFSVPLLQAFWRVGYFQGFACMLGGILIFFSMFVGFQLLTEPVENLPARLAVPLFEDHQLK